MAAGRSFMLTALSLSHVVPSLVIETTGISVAFSFTGRTLGTSTSMPNSMTCAVSMKMISSTSTTSTKGVTLISERVEVVPRLRDPYRLPLPPPLTDNAMALISAETALGHVQELQRKVVHAGADFADGVAEVVVSDGGRNGGKQAEGRRDQGFRDARSQCFEAGAAHVPQVLKCADDAQHGAEQADEGRHRSGSGQPVHIFFQLGDLFADAQLQGTFERRAIGHAAARLHLALQLFVSKIENRNQRGWAKLLAGHHHGFHAAGLAEGAQESGIQPARAAEEVPLGENHGPGVDRKTEQNCEDRPTQRARVLNHFPGINLKKESGGLADQLVS